MLVLTRRENECIVIGGAIVVRVVQCAGKVVRLGITAPREVPIHRKEVFERLKSDKRTEGSSDAHRDGAILPMEFDSS
jgi:carbon storage regulator